MTDDKKKIAAVPFDTFERYLGPRYENVPGVDFILENGTLLYFMEEAPGIYVSADHTATGQPDTPKLYMPVYEKDAMQPSAFQEIGLREKFAGILETSVPVGLPGVNRRQEPGYVLDNGLVLLESERDGHGNYRAGAGMDGMYLQTGRVFAPHPARGWTDRRLSGNRTGAGAGSRQRGLYHHRQHPGWACGICVGGKPQGAVALCDLAARAGRRAHGF